MKKIIICFIFYLCLLKLILHWSANAYLFVRNFDPIYYSGLYSKSQYVLGPKSENGIGDDGLYSFAGYYYFFQGGDVSAVNFEHPPLGKYLIGASIFLFHNEIFINIFYYLFLLFVTYKISRFYLDKYLSLLPLSVLLFDPLFLDHTIRSQLDLPFTLFVITAIYFFLLSLKKLNYLYPSQVFWGFAFSTRFFPLLIVLEIYMLLLLFKNNGNIWKSFLYSLIIIPSIYLITHISFFIYHPSIIEFLRHKKWMLAWFTGTPVKPGNILRNYFTGRLIDTLDKSVKNNEWSLLQPQVLVSSLLTVKPAVLSGFILIYMVYCIFLTGGQAKFLMPVYPLMTIFAVKNLEALYCIISQWMRLKLQPSKGR